MAKLKVVAPPAISGWTEWYRSSGLITSAGHFLTYIINFTPISNLESTVQVELEYYYNGKQKVSDVIGIGGHSITITVGDQANDYIQQIKFRLQGNSLPQTVEVVADPLEFSFYSESELDLQFGKSAEEKVWEKEVQHYGELLGRFEKRYNLPPGNSYIPSTTPEELKEKMEYQGNNLNIVGSTTRTSNLSLESLLGAEISRSADGIVDRIIGRNPNMFQASAGRFLSQSVERFGEALTKGRIDSFEDAFTSVLGGKNGALGFASDIGNQVVGGLLQSGLGKLFGGTKTSTTSYESARSIATGNAFGMSRGQQAAEMLMQLQKGQRNL